jgi:F0F1-type ATP synthase gamma subunit
MEVAAYRSRSAKTALIVVIDADTGTVEQRLTQLDKELRKNKKPKIDANTDRVARLVPRRNVETWIKCLNGDAVDEKENYKKARRDWDELAHSAGEMLFEWTQSKTLPSHCVQSLRHGITELNRLRH